MTLRYINLHLLTYLLGIVAVQLSLDGARTSLVHFRYNVVLHRVVYYPLFCLQFILMGLLTNLNV